MVNHLHGTITNDCVAFFLAITFNCLAFKSESASLYVLVEPFEGFFHCEEDPGFYVEILYLGLVHSAEAEIYIIGKNQCAFAGFPDFLTTSDNIAYPPYDFFLIKRAMGAGGVIFLLDKPYD